MRKRARTDDNHAELMRLARSLGADVIDTSMVGGGWPDFVAGFRGRDIKVEVKDGRKRPSARKLTPDQAEHHATWRGAKPVIVTCAADLIRVLTSPQGVTP